MDIQRFRFLPLIEMTAQSSISRENAEWLRYLFHYMMIHSRRLPEDAIHVWMSNLASARHFYAEFWQSLSKAEQARALRFIKIQHRHRYVICHGQLRMLLAAYLDMAPEAIEFEVDEYGKPRLKGSSVDKGLVFNISHSGDYALFGFAWNQRLGVDIEVWRKPFDMAGLVRRWFSESEKQYWCALEAPLQQAAFFNLWTRKESFLKAIGIGLSAGLDQCVIATSGPLCFQAVPAPYGRACDWRLIDIACRQGISAAITTNQPDGHLIYRAL